MIERIQAQGRFAGPKLVLSQLSGSTPGGGSISGSGTVDFTGGKAGLDLKFNASQAPDCSIATTLRRDRHRSAGDQVGRRGGTISGKLRLDSGRFTLGRASAAASVPQLKVRNIGQDPTW